MDPFAYDVYLSFTRADEKVARELWDQLTAKGLRVFWSTAEMGRHAGTDWPDVLQRALMESRHLLVILSQASLEATWVQREIWTFYTQCHHGASRRLVPVLLEDVTTRDLPVLLRTIEWCPIGNPELVPQLVEVLGGTDGTIAGGVIDVPWRSSRSFDIGGRSFADMTELYEYVTERIGQAQRSVDDITWGAHLRTPRGISTDAYNRYVSAIRKAARRKSIRYREISNFAHREYVERTRSLLKCSGYNVRYVDTRRSTVPLLSFMLIDRAEVIFAFHREPVREMEGETYLSVQSKSIVDLFQDYYETLWASGTTIKDADGVDEDALDAIACDGI